MAFTVEIVRNDSGLFSSGRRFGKIGLGKLAYGFTLLHRGGWGACAPSEPQSVAGSGDERAAVVGRGRKGVMRKTELPALHV